MTYYENFRWESNSIETDGFCTELYIECSGDGEKKIQTLMIFKDEKSMELIDQRLIGPEEMLKLKERVLHELKMKAEEPSDKFDDDYYFEYARDLARSQEEDL